MTRRAIRIFVLAGGAFAGLLGWVPKAKAQGSVSVSPWFGIYVPTQN